MNSTDLIAFDEESLRIIDESTILSVLLGVGLGAAIALMIAQARQLGQTKRLVNCFTSCLNAFGKRDDVGGDDIEGGDDDADDDDKSMPTQEQSIPKDSSRLSTAGQSFESTIPPSAPEECARSPKVALILPMVLSMIASTTSIYSVSTCDYMSNENATFGLFAYGSTSNNDSSCYHYEPGVTLDSSFLVAKVVGVMAVIFGCLSLALFAVMLMKKKFGMPLVRTVFVTLFMAISLQLTSLISFHISDICGSDKCSISSGAGNGSIGSSIYWLFTCIAMLFVCVALKSE